MKSSRGFPGTALLSWAVVLTLGLASGSMASDPPHWLGPDSMDCDSCHEGHTALGNVLTNAGTNTNLCVSCHSTGDLTIDVTEMAQGSTGRSHAYGVLAVNGARGSLLPTNAEMLLRIWDDGGDQKIICSTCHNQHANTVAMGGSPRASAPDKVTALGGTGVLASALGGAGYSGGEGAWYRATITVTGDEGGAGAAQFEYDSWNDTDKAWSTPAARTAGTGVVLGENVQVTFGAGSYQAGEVWQFYVAWPFLRASLDEGDNATGDKFCRDCHRDWAMDHNDVRNWNGGSVKSHPVGIALNTSGAGVDHDPPRDGNLAVQGGAGADSIASNDLQLFGAGGDEVQCLSCHGVHYADSNTWTEDQP